VRGEKKGGLWSRRSGPRYGPYGERGLAEARAVAQREGAVQKRNVLPVISQNKKGGWKNMEGNTSSGFQKTRDATARGVKQKGSSIGSISE